MIFPVYRFINKWNFFSIKPLIIFFLLQITIASEAQKIPASKNKQAVKEEEINTPTWTADNGYVTVKGLGVMAEVRIEKQEKGEASLFQCQDMLQGDLMLMSLYPPVSLCRSFC